MPKEKRCLSCGVVLPQDSNDEHCPQCLLKIAVGQIPNGSESDGSAKKGETAGAFGAGSQNSNHEDNASPNLGIGGRVQGFLRMRGYNDAEAKALTEAFFAWALESNFLKGADYKKGRLLSFLFCGLKAFLSQQAAEPSSDKKQPLVSLDDRAPHWPLKEPSQKLNTEEEFKRQWTLTLVKQAINRLQEEYEVRGALPPFNIIKGFLASAGNSPSYAQAAQELGMNEESLRSEVSRLRRRFRQILGEEMGLIPPNPKD